MKEYCVTDLNGNWLDDRGRVFHTSPCLMTRKQAIYLVRRYPGTTRQLVVLHRPTGTTREDANFPCPVPCRLWREGETVTQLRKLVKHRRQIGPNAFLNKITADSRKPEIIEALKKTDEQYGWAF